MYLGPVGIGACWQCLWQESDINASYISPWLQLSRAITGQDMPRLSACSYAIKKKDEIERVAKANR